MKWNSNQIITFLNIYEKYTILWDIRDKDYKNSLKRANAFDQFLKELIAIEGFGDVNLDVLKTKLKTIKTVYRQELNKCIKSKKSGSGTDDVYKPKLIWFATANEFLKNVTIIRKSTNNMIEQDSQGVENEQQHMPDEYDDDQLHTPTNKLTSNEDVPKSIQTPKRKKGSKIVTRSGIEAAVDTLKKIVEKNDANVDD
ncbi:hypothetical protein MML48_2g00001562 [Holotrichia oblita]|uniref:Uncharacterized protein n=1 Tax=Holotrichia oblita TaxID=644536 RepID=A0ACB9TMQ4_HOLOL|nr:hypothetical protein MML48_2g00001562 [Holotrichia oblita]